MSFTNNVYGGVPQSEMVFSTTNISSDNASFINLSVSGYATITNLTTINWSQPNLNASTVVTDALVVTNTSAVNLDVSGVMNVSDLNISDLNVSDLSVSTISVGDIVIDEAEVTTLRFDDVTNVNYSEIQRDNDTLTIAGGYVNGTGTQFNGDIAFTPYNLSNATPPSMVVQASDGKVYIPNMSSLDINTSNISVATLMTTNQLTATGLAQFQSTLSVVNPASQTQNFFWNTQGTTAFQLGNLATLDFNIGNDASNPNKGIIVRGGTNSSVEIPILTADNLSSTLANISTLNVSTINIADIDVPLINTSQLNASNISVDVDLKVVGRTETDILQADTLAAGCDMTSTLESSTNMYYPNNLLIDYSATQIATTVELSSNLSLNDIELLPDLVTTAVPTFSMLSGTAQITNANISTLTCDLTPNLTAGFGISITSVGGKPVIANTGGSVTDPLNLSKLNASNISCDGDITTDTITCDLTPNLTAGAGVTITSVANKPTIAAVNSVSANVSVSDFIETLQIIPSGTTPFVNQGANQGSQFISAYDYQGGTAYTAANMFTVNAGDKIVFNWKQSGWVMTNPAQASFKCWIIKGTNYPAQSGDYELVGRIYQYVYPQSDHEEINGTFVYYATSTFSFYRSQIEGQGGVITQGSDYGAATATVYRATIPNSISVPTLIDATNISVDNLSVTASLTASNIKVSNLIESENISVKRVDVVGIDFTNSGDLKSFLDVDAASLKWMLKKSLIFHKDTDAGLAFCKIDYARSNINISNLSTTNVSSVELSLSTLRLKDSTQATKASWFVYPTAMEIYTVNDFRIRNQGVTGSPDFMFMDTSRNNVNISNLSVSHFDVEFVDLTNNLSDGKGININSAGGKAVISLQDPVNISTITTENMNVSGSAANFFDGANIFGTATVTNLVSDLTNTLSAGTNITITSVGGKAQISSTGGGGSVPANLSIDNLSVTADVTIGGDLECDLTNTLSAGSNITITSVGGKAQISASGGGSVPANLSIDNLSVNFDATIGGDLKMLSADIIATSSELFIQDVTCTRNMSVSNAFGATTIAASTTLTVGTNATVTGNITASVGDITATTGTVFAPNVSGTKVTGSNLSVFNDASITRDLQVQRYFDSGRPRFMMLSRTTALGQTGSGERLMVFNTNSTGQVAGEFGVTNGGEIQVTTGGWYRLSWSIGFIRASGGDRYSFRAYNTTRTNAGNWSFDGLKDRIGSVGYCRSSSLNRETVSVGTVLRYIPASGWARIVIGAMIQSSANFASNFNGTNLRASSNFMIEFVSSASET